MMTSIENITMKRKSRSVSTFLKKTYELLNNSQNNEAVKWALNGIGFIVVNQDLFSKQILPKYFKHSNYSSFVRQLNMYNFHKIRGINSQSYFYHEYFNREDKNMMSEIKRKPQKKKKKQDDSDIDNNNENQQAMDLVPQINITSHSSIQFQKISKKISTKTLNRQLSECRIKSEHTNYLMNSEIYNEKINNNNNCNNNNDDKISSKNILSLEIQDDHLSINDEIIDRFPRLTTKQLMYPSNHNLFPFNIGAVGSSTYTLFF